MYELRKCSQNGHYFCKQHKSTGLYNNGCVCLLWGRNWTAYDLYELQMAKDLSAMLALPCTLSSDWLWAGWPGIDSLHALCRLKPIRQCVYHQWNIRQCMYHQWNIQQFCVLPTQCIRMLYMDRRTNSDYFSIQH